MFSLWTLDQLLFINHHFVFRGQRAEFFLSKKIRQMKASQNYKYDIIKTSGLVQVWKCVLRLIWNVLCKLIVCKYLYVYLRRNWRINLTTGWLNSTENFGYFRHIPSICDKGIGELTKKHDHYRHSAASAHGRNNTQSKQNLILSTWKSKLKQDNEML